MNGCRVFVVEESREEFLSGLNEFGHVIVLLDGQRPSVFSDAYRAAIHEELHAHGYDPNADYIAVVGRQVPIFILAAELAAEYVSFRALMFSSSERRYVPRVLGDAYLET